MAKRLGLVLGILILVILGFALLYRGYPSSAPVGPLPRRPAPAPAISEIIVTLSEQNDSGEFGIATITNLAGNAVVRLELAGAPKGVPQPAHIHLGSCAQLGAVKYPLSAPADGISETNLGISIEELLKDLPLAINVHKSASEAVTYVACGDIAAT